MDASTEENGCMAFVPKSHNEEFLEHEVNDEKLLQVIKKPTKFVKCELEPGKANLGELVHINHNFR